MNEPTHILINGGNLYISTNLSGIFKFIIGIEKEVDAFLSVIDKLESIRDQYVELMDFAMHQGKLLKENSINYSYEFKEDPKTISDKLKYDLPLRSQTIVLFAFLETLRVLWTAYELGTADESDLKDASDTAIDNFIKKFCLNSKNEWYKKNSKRSGKIGVSSLRNLRNNLTHFFAVSKLGLVHEHTEHVKKMGSKTNHLFQAISPTDLHEMLKSASKIMLETWSSDFSEKPDEFKRKIIFVKEIVEKKGPQMVPETAFNENA